MIYITNIRCQSPGEVPHGPREAVQRGMDPAVWLAYETKGLLIGESANRRAVDGIRELVAGFNEVHHVNEVLTMHMGPDFILLNLSVKFADAATALELEDAVARIDTRIKDTYPEVKRVFVEAEARQ